MTMDKTKQIRQNGQMQRNENHFNPNNLNLRYTLKNEGSKMGFSQQWNHFGFSKESFSEKLLTEQFFRSVKNILIT